MPGKTIIKVDSTEAFFARGLERARAMDRGEKPKKAVSITFADPVDMMSVMSAQRLQLLQAARRKELPVSKLASTLKRDPRAVSRDIAVLEQFGMLKTRYEVNPGHGRQRIVSSTAEKFLLSAAV
ncbi:MAG TPA: HTH domain-containing protein [Acidobacteriaceae bacterium]